MREAGSPLALGTQRVDKCLSLFSELYSYRTSSVGKLRKTVLCIVGEVRPSRRYNAHLPDPPAISSDWSHLRDASPAAKMGST